MPRNSVIYYHWIRYGLRFLDVCGSIAFRHCGLITTARTDRRIGHVLGSSDVCTLSYSVGSHHVRVPLTVVKRFAKGTRPQVRRILEMIGTNTFLRQLSVTIDCAMTRYMQSGNCALPTHRSILPVELDLGAIDIFVRSS